VSKCKSLRIPVTLTIIATPQLDVLTDITECDAYILPTLTNGNYYQESGGIKPIAAGTSITSTQTIWIYAETSTTPNCTNESSFVVNINLSPIINLGNDTTLCVGNAITLDAGSGFATYVWSTNETTQTIDVNLSGTYSITVTSDNLCSASDTINISVIDYPNASIITEGPFCANILPIQFIATDGGGEWHGKGISADGIFDPSMAGVGNHTITYTIYGICLSSDTIDILVRETPMVVEYLTHETCKMENDGSIELQISGGVAPYQILWNNGELSPILNDLFPGKYSYIVSDFNNCSVEGSINILEATEECDMHVYIPNIFSPNNDGENDILFVRGKGIETLDFIIYNRWGEKIFESNDVNIGWDGTFKGNKVEADVFVYIVKGKYRNNVQFDKYGNITVVY